MYSDFYDTSVVQTSSVDSTWLIVSAVLAIVGGIAAYVFFISKKNKGEYIGFVAWLHDFLNFKKFFVEVILKVMYIVTAIYITLGSFSFISSSVASFFLVLIVGNIIARIGYELILMTLTLVRNTTEINAKLGLVKKEPEKPLAKPKKKIEKEDEDEEK